MQREHLRQLLEEQCLITDSPFILSTGRASSFYFDCKRATLRGDLLNLISEAFLEEIDQLPEQPEALGGLTMGADFITAAVVLLAHRKGRAIPREGAIVRKEPKQHGTQGYIENPLSASTPVVVIDDVITTGKSTEEACRRFLDHDYKVVGIIALIDREEREVGRLERTYHCPVRAIFRKRDFPSLVIS